jgi:hypothetical protein
MTESTLEMIGGFMVGFFDSAAVIVAATAAMIAIYYFYYFCVYDWDSVLKIIGKGVSKCLRQYGY